MSLANVLTLSRIPLAAFVVRFWLVDHQHLLSVLFLMAILVTDLLDGPIARAGGRASERGALLDSGVDWFVIYGLFGAILIRARGLLELFQPLPVEALLWVVVLGGSIILVRNIRHWRTTRMVGRATSLWGKPLGAVQYAWLLLFFLFDPFSLKLAWTPGDPLPPGLFPYPILSWVAGLMGLFAVLHIGENLKALVTQEP